MRGYFGIGVEGISKALNVGSLLRTAHAFGAGFMFTVAAAYSPREGGKADTSAAEAEVPLYHFPDVASLLLPRGCRLVGVEIRDDAVALPSFRHPRTAAYVFGGERGGLTPAMIERCEFIVRIPSRFAFNVGIAGAIVLYDRLISLGRVPRRPETAGGPREPLPPPVFGPPRFRKKPPDNT